MIRVNELSSKVDQWCVNSWHGWKRWNVRQW